MKKKIGTLILLCLLTVLLTSCDEILSVVTCNEKGEKIVHNYISMWADKVYDETISLKNWKEIEFFENDDFLDTEDLLFRIVGKKENKIVIGDESTAMEISFFEGGYEYEIYSSADELEKSFSDFGSSW